MEITSRRKEVLTTQLIHMPELHASLRGTKLQKKKLTAQKGFKGNDMPCIAAYPGSQHTQGATQGSAATRHVLDKRQVH